MPILQVGRLPSEATPNNSLIIVSGEDRNWIAAVHSGIMDFINNRRSAREWLHKQSIYDLLLVFIGFPLVFWMLYRIGPFFEKAFSEFSSFIVNAIYVYFFFFFLYIFRFFFGYAQWVWPPNVIEGIVDPAKKHRLVVSAVILAVLVDIVLGAFRLLS